MIKRYSVFFLIIYICVISVSIQAAPPLSIDHAFAFSAIVKDNQTIVLQWKIAPGYYLYRDKFNIQVMKPHDALLAPPIYPSNYVTKSLPSLGSFKVYEHDMYIIQPVLRSSSADFVLNVHYQGCSRYGFCYPPVSKMISLNLVDGHVNEVSEITAEDQTNPVGFKDRLTSLFSRYHDVGRIIAFFVFGILISLTPCVLPMLPILMSILVGQKKSTKYDAFFLSLSYVLGIAITYAIVGMVTVFIGINLQVALQKTGFIIFITLIFIAMAISLFDGYQLELPLSWRTRLTKANEHQKAGTFMGTFLMGILTTLIISPCVTPVLVMALAYISQTKHIVSGGLALFFMGLGQGLPLLLLGVLGARYLPKAGNWMVVLKQIMGFFMLAVAIWIGSRILPFLITLLLWVTLMIAFGVYIARKHKTIGIVLIGLSIGFGSYALWHHNANASLLSFIVVKNNEELNVQLQSMQTRHKPVLLDFYATWCMACREMDLTTLSDSRVQSALKDVILLRADVSHNNADDQALQHRFGVIAPPTIIFFDKDHREIREARVIGYTSPKMFLQQLHYIRP